MTLYDYLNIFVSIVNKKKETFEISLLSGSLIILIRHWSTIVDSHTEQRETYLVI